jgi:alanyl-tRNA synthetase
VRHGRLLGIERPFLGEMAEVVIGMFGGHYPELIEQRDRIKRVIGHEEERFSRTLAAGIARFETLVEEVRRGGENVLPGSEVFRLYATYGFPLELTEELAAEEGLLVDRAGFEQALEAERELSRASAGHFAEHGRERSGMYVAVPGEPSAFLGYECTEADGHVIGMLNIERPVEIAEAGDHVEIVLDRTPFYPEAGGQIGDTGTISTDTGAFTVVDTQRPIPRLIVHRGTIKEGFIRTGQTAHAVVDAERREDIRRNHTATHLLHAALRDVLGKHVRQAGSLVAPDRLRFDFTSLEPASQAQLHEVQTLVNDQVMLDRPVAVNVKPYQEAMAEGAMALFGEKYGDLVRVVKIPGFSVELCGGTHVSHTGEIGLFVITSESSIASGVRRIEAITGRASVDYALRLHDMAGQLSHLLHVPTESISAQVAELSAAAREREREIERLRVELASVQVNELIGQVSTVDGIRLVASQVEAPDRDTLLQLADRLRDRLVSGVVVLGTAIDGRAALLAAVTKDMVPRGLNAGRLIQSIAPIVGGRGGGRPELAQGGGTDVNRLDAALAAAREIVEHQISG